VVSLKQKNSCASNEDQELAKERILGKILILSDGRRDEKKGKIYSKKSTIFFKKVTALFF